MKKLGRKLLSTINSNLLRRACFAYVIGQNNFKNILPIILSDRFTLLTRFLFKFKEKKKYILLEEELLIFRLTFSRSKANIEKKLPVLRSNLKKKFSSMFMDIVLRFQEWRSDWEVWLKITLFVIVLIEITF